MTKSSYFIDIIIGYNNEFITSTSTKFLGIVIENSLSWKAHTDQMIPKLCTACHRIITIKTLMSQDTPKLVYCSHFYCLMIEQYSGEVLHTVFLSSEYKKRGSRIITQSRPTDCCRELFKKLKHFTILIAIYIFTFTICSKHE
jgi:hypothetical protein